jgi:hypothetical protein
MHVDCNTVGLIGDRLQFVSCLPMFVPSTLIGAYIWEAAMTMDGYKGWSTSCIPKELRQVRKEVTNAWRGVSEDGRSCMQLPTGFVDADLLQHDLLDNLRCGDSPPPHVAETPSVANVFHFLNIWPAAMFNWETTSNSELTHKAAQ